MDRRLTPATARIAHVSLRGKLEAPAYTEGELLHVAAPLADLCVTPGGARDRQLLLGESFTVIDREGAHAFGFAVKDGHCGWLDQAALADTARPTHWVSAPATHLYPEPRVQALELASLSLGARVTVLATGEKWCKTTQGFIPTPHLRPLGDWARDPVAMAESLLGTPYLWGGNSRAGIDCSGLAQLAYGLCGIAIPSDSDLQQGAGHPVAEGQEQRGDLIFWKGHVALIVDDHRLIHANGHTMSVAHEGRAACIARILAQENRPVLARRRPTR